MRNGHLSQNLWESVKHTLSAPEERKHQVVSSARDPRGHCVCFPPDSAVEVRCHQTDICNLQPPYYTPRPAPLAPRTQRLRRGSCRCPSSADRVRGSLAAAAVRGFGRTGEQHTRSPHPQRGGAGRRLRVRPEGVWVQGGSRAAPPRGRSPGHSILARAGLPQPLPSGKVPARSWPPEAPAPTQARSTPHSSPEEKRPGRRGRPGRQHGGGAPALGCRRAASLLGDSRGRLEPGAGDRGAGALRPQR